MEIIRQRHTSFSEYSNDLTSNVTAATAVERREQAAILRKAIKHLPENEREVVMLKAIRGMTGDEIAQATGYSPANVRVLLHRGRKRIKDYLKKHNGL